MKNGGGLQIHVGYSINPLVMAWTNDVREKGISGVISGLTIWVGGGTIY